MRTHHYLAMALLILSAAVPASGEMLPSFHLDYSVWRATHIVLATEGEAIDGHLSVIESWKGNLNPGTELVLPELAAFSGEESRRIHWWGLDDPPEDLVTGSQMVLFLVKAAQQEEAPEPALPGWLPASYKGFGGFRVSVAWFERGRAYAFRQMINPGPCVLHDAGPAIEMKARVAACATIQASLDEAIEEQDAHLAAQAFLAFHNQRFHTSAKGALDSLGAMRKSALPELRQMLSNITLRSWHPDVIAAIAAAGGPEAAEDFTAVIESEFRFWSERAPKLEKGWWNADPAHERRRLREEYSRLLAALRALRPLQYAPCRDVVLKVRDLWRSNAILSFDGQSQVVSACNSILNESPNADGR